MLLLQPAYVLTHAGARQVVENQHRAPEGQQAIRQVGPDETRASGNQGGRAAAGGCHATNPWRRNSAVAASERSSSTRPSSHWASCVRPSSNCTLGWYPRMRRALEISAKQLRMSPER